MLHRQTRIEDIPVYNLTPERKMCCVSYGIPESTMLINLNLFSVAQISGDYRWRKFYVRIDKDYPSYYSFYVDFGFVCIALSLDKVHTVNELLAALVDTAQDYPSHRASLVRQMREQLQNISGYESLLAELAGESESYIKGLSEYRGEYRRTYSRRCA